MNTSGWFLPLVLLSDVITQPGQYVTRSGETVTVTKVSTKHDFGCGGTYTNGVVERWHKSGRISFSRETQNDIVKQLDTQG